MSNPETNLKKQERRHRGPLVGMGIGVALALLLLLALVIWTTSQAEAPEGAATQIDSRTGAEVDGN